VQNPGTINRARKFVHEFFVISNPGLVFSSIERIYETKKDKFRMDSKDVRFWFKLFSELHQTKRVFINCGNKGDSYGRDRSESGIVTYHAYSVLDVAKLKLNNGRSVSLGLC